jgi:hypothetical protein
MIEKLLVRKILERPLVHQWTLQGLGMLRLYLSDEVRLHLWDTSRRYENASSIHDHPWAFRSTVLAGGLTNRLFHSQSACNMTATHEGMRIKCGEGTHGAGAVGKYHLAPVSIRSYGPGASYQQAANEIHETVPEPGTVTIVERTFNADRDHAWVFWPVGQGFGTAEPRVATKSEVLAMCALALERLR